MMLTCNKRKEEGPYFAPVQVARLLFGFFLLLQQESKESNDKLAFLFFIDRKAAKPSETEAKIAQFVRTVAELHQIIPNL